MPYRDHKRPSAFAGGLCDFGDLSWSPFTEGSNYHLTARTFDSAGISESMRNVLPLEVVNGTEEQ